MTTKGADGPAKYTRTGRIPDGGAVLVVGRDGAALVEGRCSASGVRSTVRSTDQASLRWAAELFPGGPGGDPPAREPLLGSPRLR